MHNKYFIKQVDTALHRYFEREVATVRLNRPAGLMSESDFERPPSKSLELLKIAAAALLTICAGLQILLHDIPSPLQAAISESMQKLKIEMRK